MKKLFILACTLVLGSALSFAQASTPTPAAGNDTGKTNTTSTTKGKKSKTHHKGAKKSKKSTTTEPAPTPK